MREEECAHLVCWSRWRRWRSSGWSTLPPLLCSFFCFPLLSLLVLETPKTVATVSVTFLCLCFFFCLCVSWVSQSSAFSPVCSPCFVTCLSVFVSGSRPLFPLVSVPALPPVLSCFSPPCYSSSTSPSLGFFVLRPALLFPCFLGFSMGSAPVLSSGFRSPKIPHWFSFFPWFFLPPLAATPSPFIRPKSVVTAGLLNAL